MSNFTPPYGAQAAPAGRPGQRILQYEVSDEPLVRRCMGHFSPDYFAMPVFILTDGTVQEYLPPALYNANGSLETLPEDRVAYSFQGNATYQNIPAGAAASLLAAGYELS